MGNFKYPEIIKETNKQNDDWGEKNDKGETIQIVIPKSYWV